MAQTFTCPNCSAPLDYGGTDLTVRCPYCNSSVIVPEKLRSISTSNVSHPPSLPVVGMDSLLGQAMQLKEVAALIRSGNKIQAIKVYRETFNVGLAEAKDAVEALAAGRPVVMPGSSGVVTTQSSLSYGVPGYGAPTYGQPSTGGPEDEIGRLLRAGNKIEAIKVYRQTYGSGLKEAKDAVETYERGFPLPKPANPMPVSSTVSSSASSSIPTYSAATTSGRYSNQQQKPSFFRYIFWFGIACFPVAFVLTMLGLAFPNTARLAAPVLCPENYIDAYGEVEVVYDSDGTGYNLNLLCVKQDGSLEQPNGFIFAVTLYGLYFAAALEIAFGLACLLRFRWVGCVVLLGSLITVPVLFTAYVSTIPSRSEANPFLNLLGFGGDNNNPIAQFIPATEGPAPTSTPAPSPTPSFTPLLLTIGGEEGLGDGQFNDTRTLAVDGDGNIYAADYDTGRIQAFDPEGEFLSSFTIDEESIYISGLAADNAGTLYVVYRGGLHRFNGLTGEPLPDFANMDTFSNWDDVAVTRSGDIVLVSSDVIAVYSPEGEQKVFVEQWSAGFSSQGFPSLTVDNVAVDRSDNIYIASSMEDQVFKFSPEGQFLDRIGVAGDGPGEFDGLYALAVDSRNRIYGLDYDGIQVLNARGGYLGLIEIESLGFDIAVHDEALYVMDRNANKILKFALPESE